MEKRNLDRKGALNLTAVGMFIGAIVLAALTAVMTTKVAEGGWADFLKALREIEDIIAHLPYKWLICLAILLVFALKNFIPIPFPFIFMMTGVLFERPWALLINTIGFCIVLTGKYFWGRKFGGGAAIKNLKKYDNVREMLYKAGPAKFGALIALRLIPSIPVNMVSKIYGGMNFPFWQFLCASLIGFSIKIYTYSVMGGNITQPFTWKFMGPIIALLVVSGVSTLVVNIVLEKRNGDNKNGKTEPCDE